MERTLLLTCLLSVPLLSVHARSTGTARHVANELQEKVDAAIASGAPTLTIPGGAYHFGETNFQIVGARNLALLAPEPITLWFSKSSQAGVNITNAEDLSLGNWTIDYENSGEHELRLDDKSKDKVYRAITLHLFNSTRVDISNLIVRQCGGEWPMVLTAFNGGGAHKFTGIKFESTLNRLARDAIHFSDQRVGPTIKDSVIGYTADDLFNIHTTLMIVLKCETPTSCLIVNPHLQGPESVNTVYGTNSVMQMVVPGLDKMSFFSWITDKFVTTRYGGAPPLPVVGTERIVNRSLLEEAATLVPELAQHGSLNPVSLSNTTVQWHAWDVWRVEFADNVPAGVGRTAMVQIDTISNAGTVLKNNLFTDTNCNLGRYKCSDSLIEGNTFRNAAIQSLELSWLPQFFEGPVMLSNVTLASNTFQSQGKHPIHCGPFCGSEQCLYDKSDQPTGTWTNGGCPQCPDCAQARGGNTQWTKDIHLRNNSILPMSPLIALV